MKHRNRARRGTKALLCIGIGTLGCSSQSGDARPTDTGFALAYFHDDCAPWDGGALTVVLSRVAMGGPFEAAYPHARITSYLPPARLAGSGVEWSGADHDDGYAALCDSADACTPAARVELRFDRAQADRSHLRGEVYLELDDGRVIGGPFEARRIDFQALCG